MLTVCASAPPYTLPKASCRPWGARLSEPDQNAVLAGMTGICGLAVRTGGAAEGLPAMLEALADYGAAAGRRRADAAALGAVGPEGAAPLVEAGGLTIAADARLDDPAQLREALGLKPRDGRIADAALILRAYLRWGRDCVERLYGDFAFVVWDAPRRRLFCARDALGARPFYYALNARRFAFATALEAVLAAPGVGAELDERRVSAHLASPWRSFRRRTFLREVLRLAPGHTLTVDAGRLRPARQRRWWRPEGLPTARGGSAEEHGEGLLGELDRAVRARVGDGPVGVELSGGLDSSAVAVLAARELRRRGLASPPAFTWLPPPPEPMPPEWAEGYERLLSVAAQEGLRLFYHTRAPGDFLRNLSEDRCLPGAGVGYPVLSAAGEGVRVLLTGLGGDECVSNTGAGRDFGLLLSGRWPSLLAHLREHGLRPAREIPKMLAGLLHPGLLPGSRFWRLVREGRLWSAHERSQLRNRWLINAQFARRSPPMAAVAVRPLSVRRRQLHRLRHGHLSQRMEAEAATSARWGLEYRYPLLDRRLVEFALSRPPEAFCGPPTRFLMRCAVSGLLPSGVCWSEDKTDPAVHAAFVEAFALEMPSLRRAVLATGAPLTRAGYVDVPRLLERLGDVEEFRRRPRPLPILSALSLLDFQPAPAPATHGQGWQHGRRRPPSHASQARQPDP